MKKCYSSRNKSSQMFDLNNVLSVKVAKKKKKNVKEYNSSTN